MEYRLIVSDDNGEVNSFEDEELLFRDEPEDEGTGKACNRAVEKAYDIRRHNPAWSVDLYCHLAHYEKVQGSKWRDN